MQYKLRSLVEAAFCRAMWVILVGPSAASGWISLAVFAGVSRLRKLRLGIPAIGIAIYVPWCSRLTRLLCSLFATASATLRAFYRHFHLMGENLETN